MWRALLSLIGLLCCVWTINPANAQDEARANLAVGADKTVAHERIGWYVDRTTDAQKQARELGRKLVLILSPSRCEDCRELERDVLACPAINRFAGHAVFALANPSRDALARSIMGTLKVAIYPAILMIDPANPGAAPLVHVEGYLSAGNLSLYLHERMAIADAGLPSLDDGVALWKSKIRSRPGAPQDCAIDPDGPLPGLSSDDLLTTEQASSLEDDIGLEVAGADCRTKIDEYDDLAVDCASVWPKWSTAASAIPALIDGAALAQPGLALKAGSALYGVFGFDDEVEFGRGNGRFLGLAVGVGPRTLIATCHALGNHALLALSKDGGATSGAMAEVKVSAADAAGDRCWLSLEASEQPIEVAAQANGVRPIKSIGSAESMTAVSLLQGNELSSYQVRLERVGESDSFIVPDADVVLDAATAGAVLFDRRGNLVGFIPVSVKDQVRPNLVLPAERFWQP